MQIDIAELLASQVGKHLRFALRHSQEKNREKELGECINIVLLFQSYMEAVINEEIFNHPLLESVNLENQELGKKYKSLSFRNKWKKAYEALNIKDDTNLKRYLHFYSSYRTPLIHPKSRYIQVKKYTYKNIIQGVEEGWYTAQLLYAILGRELVSWEEFLERNEMLQNI